MDAKKEERRRWGKLWVLISAMAGSAGVPAVFGSVFKVDIEWEILGSGIVIFGCFWIPYLFMKKYKVVGVLCGVLPVIGVGILCRESLWQTITGSLIRPMMSNISRYLEEQEIDRELLSGQTDMMEGMVFGCGIFLAMCVMIGTVRKLRALVFLLYMAVFALPFLNGVSVRPEGAVFLGLAILMLVMASPETSTRPLAVAAIAALLFGIFLPKQKIEEFFSDPFEWQKGIEELVQKAATGGVTDGKLGTVDQVEDSGEEQLEIILSDRPEMRLYLQGFVGMDYLDNQWTSTQNTGFFSVDDIREIRNQEYETVKNNPHNVQYQSVTAEIIRKGADRKYSYIPYKSDFTEGMYGDAYVKGGKESYSVNALLVENIGSMNVNPENVTYEESGKLDSYASFVNERYLQVPEGFYNQWIEEISGIQDRTLRVFVKNLAEYLEEKAEYSKSPGKTPDGEDFVSYFLETGKKGYCVHFASAGVLFLRMKGFPARFVSGYVARPSDFYETEDGKYKAVLDDSAAHAWAEVYVSGCGWLPAEMTPGYRNGTDSPVNIQNNMQQEGQEPDTQETPQQEPAENEEDVLTEHVQGEEDLKEKKDDSGVKNEKDDGTITMLRSVFVIVATSALAAALMWKRRWRRIHFQKSRKKRYLQMFCLMREMMEADLKKEIPEETEVILGTLVKEYEIVSERTQGVIECVLETAYGKRKVKKEDEARMKKLVLNVRNRIVRKRKGIRCFVFFFSKGF